jgi:hypothetical protein
MKKPKTQGGLPGRSPLRSDGSHVTHLGRLGCVSSSQIPLKQSVKTILDSQETYETGKVVAQLKRVNLLFIWECWRGEIVKDDEESAAATLSTVEPFAWAQY